MGYRNRDIVKGVSFFGLKCEYVVSGLDCGRIFIWRKKDGEFFRVMEVDKYVVNCIEFYLYIIVFVSSGIESNIKIWILKVEEKVILLINIDEVFFFFRIFEYDVTFIFLYIF